MLKYENIFVSYQKVRLLDNCTSWKRWQEHWFHATTKLQQDYINRLARTPKPKGEQSSPKPKAKSASTSDALTYQQVSREIVANDFSIEELEHLQETIAAELKRKRASDTETAALVTATDKQYDAQHQKPAKKPAKKKAEPKRAKTIRMLPQTSQTSDTINDNPFRVVKKTPLLPVHPLEDSDSDSDEDTDSNLLDYGNDTDAAIEYARSNAKPNLDQYDGAGD